MRWWLVLAVVLSLASLVGVQTLRLANERTAHTQTKAAWAEDVATRAQADAKKSEGNRKKEGDHADQITEAVDQYQAGRAAESAGRIAVAVSLQRSAETRAAHYSAMSKAGETERERLASHAAGLDGSLAEGRIVAEQLRATVVERDEQIRLIGGVIKPSL